MADRILTDLLSRLTARRRLFGSALGVLTGLIFVNVDASRQGKRRKKKKRELRKRTARQNARRQRRLGRRYEADCLRDATAPGLVCPDELASCCHHFRDLDIDGYCLCLLAIPCDSYCLDWP